MTTERQHLCGFFFSSAMSTYAGFCASSSRYDGLLAICVFRTIGEQRCTHPSHYTQKRPCLFQAVVY